MLETYRFCNMMKRHIVQLAHIIDGIFPFLERKQVAHILFIFLISLFIPLLCKSTINAHDACKGASLPNLDDEHIISNVGYNLANARSGDGEPRKNRPKEI